jgi:hypothetical protein
MRYISALLQRSQIILSVSSLEHAGVTVVEVVGVAGSAS